MLRNSVLSLGFAVTALLAFQVGGCSSGGGGSNGRGGTTGTGGTSTTGTGGNSSSAGAGGTTGTGGTATGTGGNAAGAAGSSAGGSGGSSAGGTGGSGTGGATAGTGGSGTGGSGTGGGGTGGSGTGGSGTGGSGTGGTGGSGTGGTGFGTPVCGSTMAGTAVAKNVACTAADTQLCYKTCGPQNKGVKSETCAPGGDGGMAYMEMTGCSYDPAGNYACYKIPTTANAECPTGVPMGGASCTVADACTVCNDMGGIAGGSYMDSTSTKQGFCVCASGKWACASNTAWPCGGTPTPNNPGCQ
jgi:hypothetical protein